MIGQTVLHIDFETRSVVDLKKCGLPVYAADPTTDVWCAAYAFDDGEPKLWWIGEPCPYEIAEHVLAGDEPIFAHNANFEIAIWRDVLGARHGWPVPDYRRFYCTAAMAAAMNLPRDLERAAIALGLDVKKDMLGRRTMLQMCRPRAINPDGSIVWWDDPERRRILGDYCMNDVRVEQRIERRVRHLSDTERRLWLLDYEINNRGVAIDEEAIDNAKAVAGWTVADLNRELGRLTNHEATAITQVQRIVDWLQRQGVDVESLARRSVKQALRSVTDPKARRVLEIRQQAAKSSVAKLDAFKAQVSKDGRLRQQLLYHGAGTGRWAGRGVQLQNLPRGTLGLKESEIELAFDLFHTRDPATVELVFGPALPVISDCLRSLIVAAPGRVLVARDYANIEGRVLAWLAGEEWKLDAFRAYDNGTGPDLYLLAYSRSFGVPVASVTKPQRQIGKVQELALGYQGGHGAFISMAQNYDMSIPDVAAAVKAVADPVRWEMTAEGRSATSPAKELPLDEWVGLRILVDNWRDAHGNTRALWNDLEETTRLAVENPGTIFRVQSRNGFAGPPIAYLVKDNVLWCRLPSGRVLAYCDPRIEDAETPWGDVKPSVTYMAMDSTTNKWCRHKGYGGLWAENITQAVARDVLAEAMLALDRHGIDVVLTVHDEIVCETDEGADASRIAAIMDELPPWAAGLPLASDGWVGKRYRK